MAELKFTKSTDSEEEIKLDSTLIYAEWRSGQVMAGETASLEVATSFVGDGAPVKIKGKSRKGKKLGKLKGKMRSNKFVGELEIPDDIEVGDRVYFEADLPDNSLSGTSDDIPVVARIQVSNMKWSADEARRGDILTLTADVENVRDETEAVVTIYEHDRDGAHDKICEIPALIKDGRLKLEWEYEYHEDTDEIATQQELDRYGGSYNPPEYFFTVEIYNRVFGKKQESKLLTFKDWIEIQGEDAGGKPLANGDYVVKLPDGTEKKGKLDQNGFARVDGIPPGKGEIVITPAE
ncbi:MAG: hypothetical protein JSW34_07170 [Candidatus Zixiibacteriota bacterium]|nr:MAG: hypothetical protein JSW34_07170 [candidate division Zixibacteria bacterium]